MLRILLNSLFAAALIILASCLQPSLMADYIPSDILARSVDNFEVEQVLAREAIRKLAEDQHIVVGISGTLIGSDNKLIDIKLSKTNIKGVLDAIVAADSRFSWSITSSGSIRVGIGLGLDLISIRCRSWRLSKLPSTMLASRLQATAPIEKWLRANACSLNEITIFGVPDTKTISLNMLDQTVADLLDSISLESKSYLWSVLKFSENPCAINLVP